MKKIKERNNKEKPSQQNGSLQKSRKKSEIKASQLDNQKNRQITTASQLPKYWQMKQQF